MRKIFALSLLFVSFSGCVEEYDLNRDKIDPRLVVEGVITNKPGPYYIRLTESHTGNFTKPDIYFSDSSTAILNAQIIVSDNINQIDTLIPDDLGFYKTKNLIGIPNRTYFLKIISKDKVYEASDFMASVPQIDSLGYTRKVSEKDKAEYFIPLLYFSEPQGIKNYYLIQLIKESNSRISAAYTLWQFSILSDEFLQPYVNGLNVSLGETPRSIEYPIYMEGDSIYLALSSLTQNAYQFYKALLQQFNNDGGAYQPSPGSPPTNMSNGALGYFRASAVVEKTTKIKGRNSLF